jgi:hypothetical protein
MGPLPLPYSPDLPDPQYLSRTPLYVRDVPDAN